MSPRLGACFAVEWVMARLRQRSIIAVLERVQESALNTIRLPHYAPNTIAEMPAFMEWAGALGNGILG